MKLEQLLGYDKDQLQRWVIAQGWPSYRTGQILRWVYVNHTLGWHTMTNLTVDLQHRLARHFQLRSGRLEESLTADDGSAKLLLRLADASAVETVIIPSEEDRCTVCLSTQVGCAAGCVFCASGLGGLARSLEAAEIVEQVMWAYQHLKCSRTITNVVVMGMGEPLANYENTLKAVKIINADWGLHIGARHITISTIGLPDKIRRLAAEPIQVTLAVSLHAPDDGLRAKLVPWSKNISIDEIFSAIDYYYDQTHREVTLEYVLLDDINSSLDHADRFGRLARQSRCNVNLINYNAVERTAYRPASRSDCQAFMQRLCDMGVNTHLRRSAGVAINAACGQLRYRQLGVK